ncbi:MAG TPA: hypothetical protein VEL76_15305 [Gemmataceae bacterium]|nr:hypothetical protein [Gemmataceae bacterium]
MFVVNVHTGKCPKCGKRAKEKMGVTIEFERRGDGDTAFLCLRHFRNVLESVYFTQGIRKLRELLNLPPLSAKFADVLDSYRAEKKPCRS